MKISNLHIEKKDNISYLAADVETLYTRNTKLWFSVPSEYESYLSDDVYDAFLVAAIYPAMYYNECIEIDGFVSQKLFFNLTNYVQYVVKNYRSEMHSVEIKVKGFLSAKQIETGVGTGFSAGVDSFTTFVDHFVNETNLNYKISALFFFNVGSHGGGGENARKKFHARYNLLKAFPESVGLPYILLDSNLFDFYQPHWEYDAGLFCRASAILTLQRRIQKYYISSDYSYREVMYTAFNPHISSLSGITETFMNPLLATEALEIITDGAQYTRTEKMSLIVDYPPTRRFLNVCVDHWQNHDSATNCGMCSKCMRTLIALESLGKLNEFQSVFDIKKYQQKAYPYKCLLRLEYKKTNYNKDNFDFAVAKGLRMPNYIEALIRMLPLKIKRKMKQFFRIQKK